MSHDFSTLQSRLNAAQADIAHALDKGDTERLPMLVQEREADIAALASGIPLMAADRAWISEYLTKDKVIIARLLVARDVAPAKLSDLKRARGVHRAYLSAGLS